ncbi:hypothetical protein [Runella sp.]|uniref:hypothetical protein n=1 Tax=Runella sp. TaxID=1960881 RepID=UPI003D14802C
MATKPSNTEKNKEADEFPGYPLYPPSEDIYSRATKEEDIDPDDPSRTKELNDEADQWNEKDFKDDVSGGDLDVPGAELDDDLEEIGSEDEENNYYSLGGDNHIDLEEYKGE